MADQRLQEPTSEDYEAGYIHGGAFARLSIAINAVSETLALVGGDERLREVIRVLVEVRDDLSRGGEEA